MKPCELSSVLIATMHYCFMLHATAAGVAARSGNDACGLAARHLRACLQYTMMRTIHTYVQVLYMYTHARNARKPHNTHHMCSEMCV